MRFSILYENCAFLPIFWGGNGTVILVGCNSPFCENCFSLRFRDFSKSRSNENYFSQTFSCLNENYLYQIQTARLTARTAPSNGPEGPSNGPDGPPNGPDSPSNGPDGPPHSPDGLSNGPDGPSNGPDGPPHSPDGPSNGPDGPPYSPDSPSNGPDGPPNGQDGGAGYRRLRPG